MLQRDIYKNCIWSSLGCIPSIKAELFCTSNRDWSKNEYFNCTTNPEDNPSVERCGVPFSCCLTQSAQNVSGEPGHIFISSLLLVQTTQKVDQGKSCWLEANAIQITLELKCNRKDLVASWPFLIHCLGKNAF